MDLESLTLRELRQLPEYEDIFEELSKEDLIFELSKKDPAKYLEPEMLQEAYKYLSIEDLKNVKALSRRHYRNATDKWIVKHKISEILDKNYYSSEDIKYLTDNYKLVPEKKLFDFIDHYAGEISGAEFTISEDFLIYVKDVIFTWVWGVMSMKQDFTEYIIEELEDYVEWYEISKKRKYSKEFVEKFKNKLHFNIYKQFLTNDEQIKYKNKIIIDTTFYTIDNLTEELIDIYFDDINWYIMSNTDISIDLLIKYKNYLNWSYASLNRNILKNINNIKKIGEIKDYFNWEILSSSITDIDENPVEDIGYFEDFITRNEDKIDWEYMRYFNFTEEFKEKYKDRLP